MSALRSDVAAILDQIPVDFGGGCSLSKAYLLAWLIRRYNLQTTVDIGVYRGRSLFPQALAHRRFTGGVVYGVDPWLAAEVREQDNPTLREEIDRFVDRTDFEAVYREVVSLRERWHLEEYCFLLRTTSEDAIAYFQADVPLFDLIHIDGNHDTEKVMLDIRLYLPRLDEGGFVVLDDASWESVKPAYEALNATMPMVFARLGRGDIGAADDYAVFWKGASARGAAARRKAIAGADIDGERERLRRATREIKALIPPGETFLLVDEGLWEDGTFADRRRLPFRERDGRWWGPPPDDAAAIQEIERLRREGARFLVFAWPAFWWLEHYTDLRRHLGSQFRCLRENERLVVFDLSEL